MNGRLLDSVSSRLGSISAVETQWRVGLVPALFKCKVCNPPVFFFAQVSSNARQISQWRQKTAHFHTDEPMEGGRKVR